MSEFFIEKPINFYSQLEVSTVFMEFEEKLLLLLRPPCEWSSSTWGIPGGKLEQAETPLEGLIREIKEELGIHTNPSNFSHSHTLYVQHPRMEYKLHLFQWKLDSIPSITLNPQEHLAYLWQPISDFSLLPLLEGQLEAFYFVYGKNQQENTF